MRHIKNYVLIVALNLAVAEVIKTIIRSRPDTHAKYIDYLQEQAKHEIDRFQRLHKAEKE